MKIKKISYRRVKNLGNYENEVFEAEMHLTDTDDENIAFDELKHYVNKRLGLNNTRRKVGE